MRENSCSSSGSFQDQGKFLIFFFFYPEHAKNDHDFKWTCRPCLRANSMSSLDFQGKITSPYKVCPKVMKYIYIFKLKISVQSVNNFQSIILDIYTFFPPTLPCPVRSLKGLHGNLLYWTYTIETNLFSLTLVSALSPGKKIFKSFTPQTKNAYFNNNTNANVSIKTTFYKKNINNNILSYNSIFHSLKLTVNFIYVSTKTILLSQFYD